MWHMTNLADWWDKEKLRAHQTLDQFVENNPNQFGVIVATATFTSMELGSGLVDLLRLGDGFKQGTWKGAAQDSLRAVAVFGPGVSRVLAKNAAVLSLANTASRAKSTLKLILDPGGHCCAWVAATRALAQMGKTGKRGRLFASVEDLAKQAKVHFSQIGPINLNEIGHVLQRVGVKVGPVRPVKSLQDVINMLPKDGSTAMVSVGLNRNGREFGRHAVYAFYKNSNTNTIKIMDRRQVFENIQELANNYKATSVTFYCSMILHKVSVKFLSNSHAVLAVEVQPVVFNEN